MKSCILKYPIKIPTLHACQSLLDIISNVLGKGPPEVLVSATYDVDNLGAFEWKKNIDPLLLLGIRPLGVLCVDGAIEGSEWFRRSWKIDRRL
ncbi:hypothetical protein ACFX14_007500 [Malus domestica]